MISKNIKFHVRTPLFIGGIERDSGSEVNSSGRKMDVKKIPFSLNENTFRGVLRWWLRAVACSNDVHEQESELFGSTNNASPFKMKIVDKKIEKRKYWSRNTGAQCYGTYRVGKKNFNYDGLKYFSNNLESISRGTKFKREYLKPDLDSYFTIKITAKNEKVLNQVLMMIWLAFQFGGVGMRSRRAFGNLHIQSVEIPLSDNKIFSFKNTYADKSDYKKTILNNIEIIRNEFINSLITLNTACPCFSSSKLFLSTHSVDKYDWKEAINLAGVTMQYFRSLRENDYSGRINFDTFKEVERASFGMPIEFRFSAREQQPININVYDKNNINQATRLASPVWCSVTEINNKYHVQYLIFHINYSGLLIKRTQNEIEKTSAVRDILCDFENYLLNPVSHKNSGNLFENNIDKLNYINII